MTICIIFCSYFLSIQIRRKTWCGEGNRERRLVQQIILVIEGDGEKSLSQFVAEKVFRFGDF